MNLKDKIVVITGAAGGLGKELALILSNNGCGVVASDLDEQKLENAFFNQDILKVVVDVSEEKSVIHLVEEATKKFGRIDLWINNAAIWMPHAPIEDQESKKVRKMFEVNFFGTFYGSKEAAREMKQQGGGMICNIISTSALEGRPNSSGYCASKFAVRGLTDSLKIELADFDISVLAVYPDKMKTDLFDPAPPSDYDAFMEPNEVANIIIDNFKLDDPKFELIIR